MRYEKYWVKSIKNDLINLTEEEFDELEMSLDAILNSPNSKTKRIKGWKYNIRRIRFGNHRLLIYVDEITLTVYVLAFLPRKESYSEETRKTILSLVSKIKG